MPIKPITPIQALPLAPDPDDRSTFNTRAYPWSAALDLWTVEANQLAADTNENAQYTFRMANKTDGFADDGYNSAKSWAVGGDGDGVPELGSARQWAADTGYKIDDVEYSAKEYAVGGSVEVGSAKAWATATGAAVADNLYSARYYAESIASDAQAAHAAAQKAKNYAVLTGGLPEVGEHSAKSWAVGGTGAGQPTEGSAKDWAVGQAPIQGQHSAKYHADTARQYAENAGNMLGINFGGFALVDGELIVTHLSTVTPALVDGEFVFTYEEL